jgi:hypothetical protein
VLFVGLLALVVAGGSGRAAGPPRQGRTVVIEPTSGATFYREPGQARRRG